ncbi:MAG: prepilin-type N-terminal cleavage/methylation domain-containing protein, partial [Syntrophales bacterium]|nr:prepilin-type N-terminal cleavage/methylation domain-containing protein [Syntrophales bacterium]
MEKFDENRRPQKDRGKIMRLPLTPFKERSDIFKNRESGFTLLELVIAMALGLVILGAMYSVFTVHQKTFRLQEHIAEMQQNARAAMDMISREIKLAGYNPSNAAFAGISYNASYLQLKADLNRDGIIYGAHENVIYGFDAANGRITRDTGYGAEPMVDNVHSFTFEYLDKNGYPATMTGEIRQMRISIVLKAAQPDPSYSHPVFADHYRRYTLTSLV